MTLPYITVSGTPYQMGLQHGQQAAAQVRAFVEHLIQGAAPRHSREEVLAAAGRFLPLFEEHCPSLVEEIHGLAEGAGISFREALLIQIRGEVHGALREACTTFAVGPGGTRDGGILIGQTSDMTRDQMSHFLVLRLIPEDGPRTLMWTFAGHLGYHGLNEYGVAHFANSLSGGPAWRLAMPHYPVKRRLFECRTQAEVQAMWDRIPVCSSGNYMCAAGDPAIFNLEVTPQGYGRIADAGQGFLVHTNHFLTAGYRTDETDHLSPPDSFPRLDRMTSLIQDRLGDVTLADVQGFLADHANAPHAICRHQETDEGGHQTVAALVAEPRAGRLHVCPGNACTGEWTTYCLYD
jgi:hypothetical protein